MKYLVLVGLTFAVLGGCTKTSVECADSNNTDRLLSYMKQEMSKWDGELQLHNIITRKQDDEIGFTSCTADVSGRVKSNQFGGTITYEIVRAGSGNGPANVNMIWASSGLAASFEEALTKARVEDDAMAAGFASVSDYKSYNMLNSDLSSKNSELKSLREKSHSLEADISNIENKIQAKQSAYEEAHKQLTETGFYIDGDLQSVQMVSLAIDKVDTSKNFAELYLKSEVTNNHALPLKEVDGYIELYNKATTAVTKVGFIKLLRNYDELLILGQSGELEGKRQEYDANNDSILRGDLSNYGWIFVPKNNLFEGVTDYIHEEGDGRTTSFLAERDELLGKLEVSKNDVIVTQAMIKEVEKSIEELQGLIATVVEIKSN